MNNYTAIGRIGKDAVTRQVGSDTVTSWSLAVDSGFGKSKQTLWWDCSLWGKRGEAVAEYLVKGTQIGVEGEPGTREHDGKTYLTLRTGNVTLIGGKPEGQRQDAPKRRTDGSVETYDGGIRQDPMRNDLPDDDIPFDFGN